MATPTFRAAADNAGGVSPTAVNKPTGTAQNDALLATVSRFSTNGTLTGPSGWTKIGSELTVSSQMWTSFWWKVAGASEPSTYTWTSTGDAINAEIVSWQNCDTTTPIDVSQSGTSTGASTITIPSVTPTVSGGIQVGLMANLLGPYNAAPSGWVQDDTDGGQSNGEDHRTATLTASTASGTGSQTLPGNTPYIVLAVALKPSSSGTPVNGSSTILAEAGILGGINGSSALPGGISAASGLPGGISGSGATGGGIQGQGEIQAKSTALNQASVEGQAGFSQGLSGQAGVSSGQAGQAGVATGQAGNGAVGIGLAGQGEVNAHSQALASVTLTGLAGFISGFAGQALVAASGALGGAVNGLATILGLAGLLEGFGGQGEVHGSNVSLNQATVTGAGNVQSNFLAGIAQIVAQSAALVHATIFGSGAVGSGQSGSGSSQASSAATPGLTLKASGALSGGLIAGISDILASAQSIFHPPFRIVITAVQGLLNLVFGQKSNLSVTFAEKSGLNLNFAESAQLTIGFAEKANLTLTFTLEPPVAYPNSTIIVTATATDISGNPVSNMATVTVTVTFPDGTTQNFSLSSGVTNAGSGKYTITYNTKTPGQNLEDWVMIDPVGNKTEYHNITPVGF